MPKALTGVDYYAFENCTSLEGVYISNLKGWCSVVFANKTSNPLHQGANLYIDGSLATDIVIPQGVNIIEDYAFCGCTSLTGVTFSDSVTKIRNDVFSECTSLTSIIVSEGITGMGAHVFHGCNNLVIYCEQAGKPLSGWYDLWNSTNCTVYWYRASKPSETGDYWHYGENGEIAIWETVSD